MSVQRLFSAQRWKPQSQQVRRWRYLLASDKLRAVCFPISRPTRQHHRRAAIRQSNASCSAQLSVKAYLLTVVVSGREKFNPQHCNLTTKHLQNVKGGGLEEERSRNQSAEPPKFSRTISRVLITAAIESKVMKKDQSETLFICSQW